VVQVRDPDGMGDFSVVVKSQKDTDRTCRKLGTTKDDIGRKAGDIRACYDYKDSILYTSKTDPQLLRHELCHRANPPKWDGEKWVYDNNCSSVPWSIWE